MALGRNLRFWTLRGPLSASHPVGEGWERTRETHTRRCAGVRAEQRTRVPRGPVTPDTRRRLAGRPAPTPATSPPLRPSPFPALRGPDSPSCVSTAALSCMELWAGAEPSVLPLRSQPRPCHRLGAPSRGRRVSGAEPGAARGGGASGGARSGAAAAGSAADPVLWLCTAMPSTVW